MQERRRKGKISKKTYHLHWLLSVVVVFIIFGSTKALECYVCDSAEDPECATNPGQQISVEECASDTDECVQVVVAGITRRGCLLRLFPSRYCPEPCERCTKSLCNRDVFPRNRLLCYQCSGADCVNVDSKPELIRACPFYFETDRCYMKVLHISNVQRGCEHSVTDSDTCPNSCIKCNYNGCNNEPGISQKSCLECYHSTIGPDPGCWRGQDLMASQCVATTTKYCQNKNLYGHDEKRFMYINEQTGVVQRGCSSTKPFFPTGNLTECYGENCNNGCLTISCNVCSSKDDANCKQGKNLKATKCAAGTQSCFSCEKGNQLRRGCADEDFETTRQEHEACYMCRDSTGCNRYPVRTCYSCSSLDDGDCAAMSYPDTANIRNCSSYDDLCVSTVVSKLSLTYVLRGCESYLDECTDNDPLCVRCNGSLCNNVAIDLSNAELTKRKITTIQLPLVEEQHLEMIARSDVNKVNTNLIFILMPLLLVVLYFDL